MKQLDTLKEENTLLTKENKGLFAQVGELQGKVLGEKERGMTVTGDMARLQAQLVIAEKENAVLQGDIEKMREQERVLR